MQDLIAKTRQQILSRPLPYLFFLFALVQLVLYWKIGVFTGLEADKYVIEGNMLYDQGHFTDSKYIFYLPVILLVYLSRALGVSYHLVVIVQVLLSGLALYYFYKLGNLIGNIKIAVTSSILLILFFPLQVWNFYLYTDSIFISLTIIYAYIICRWGDRGLKGTLFILLFLALLQFARPHGFLFIPCTIVYLLLRQQTRASFFSGLALSALLLFAMYFLLNAAFTGGGDMDAMKPFIEEHIICFVPMKPEGTALDIVKTANPVNDLFYYIIHNPFHFVRLMFLKLLSFFNMTRPYYSTGHNLFLLLFFIPIYIMSIPGIYYLVKAFRNFSTYLLAMLVLYPLGATFQCDDWHSRFAMVTFPYFILLACIGVYGLLQKRNQKKAIA